MIPPSPCRKNRNWPSHHEAPKRRGSATIWIGPEVVRDAAPVPLLHWAYRRETSSIVSGSNYRTGRKGRSVQSGDPANAFGPVGRRPSHAEIHGHHPGAPAWGHHMRCRWNVLDIGRNRAAGLWASQPGLAEECSGRHEPEALIPGHTRTNEKYRNGQVIEKYGAP